MLKLCFEAYEYAIEAFVNQDKELALKAIENEIQADELETVLRAKHIKRLTNQQCNVETGIIFLDVLAALERISDHARNVAEMVLEQIN